MQGWAVKKKILLLTVLITSMTIDAKSAQAIIKSLKAGNAQFVKAPTLCVDLSNRTELAVGQNPEVTIVGCSDSRVPPEILFGLDRPLGVKFVVRTAGNLCPDGVALGSVEFAHGVLGSKVIVVLGHSECGAVKATVDKIKSERAGKRAPHGSKHIQAIVHEVAPALVDLTDEELNDLNIAVAANARFVAQKLRDHFGDTASVYAAVYNLATGRVSFLSDEDESAGVAV